jgi:hypothetical protein
MVEHDSRPLLGGGSAQSVKESLGQSFDPPRANCPARLILDKLGQQVPTAPSSLFRAHCSTKVRRTRDRTNSDTLFQACSLPCSRNTRSRSR